MTHDTSGTQEVHQYLTDSENSRFAGQEVNIVERWQGRDNLLWHCSVGGQEAVLKLFLEAGQVRADRQFSGQERFAPLGLAPSPLWQDRQPDPLPRPVLVYEWIGGEPFDGSEPGAWEALAETVARIHDNDSGDYTRFSPHPINLGFFWQVWQGSRDLLQTWLVERKVTRLQPIFTALWQRVDQLMNAALPIFGESAPTLIHGDLLLEHVILHRGQTVLVDWKLFGLGDPAQEVARFFFFNDQVMDESCRRNWLQHYLSRRDDPGLAQRIELYSQILPFQSLTSLLAGINRELLSNPAQIAELDANRSFLVETVAVALARSVVTLLAELPIDNQEALREEIDRLLR